MDEFNIRLEQQQHFCYPYITSKPQAYIGIGFIAIVIGITFMAFYQSVIIHHCHIQNIAVKMLYVMIYLQGLGTLLVYIVETAKTLYGEIMFWDFQYKISPLQQQSEKYSKATKYFFVLDLFSIFFMEIFLMLVQYNLYICVIFSSRNVILLFQQLRGSFRNHIKFKRISVKVFKIYFGVRTLSLVLVILFFAIKDPKSFNTLVNFILYVHPVFSFFMLIFFIIGFISIKRNLKLKQIVQERQIKTIVKYYYVLILCTIFRFVIQLVYASFKYNKLFQQPNCFPSDDEKLSLSSILGLIDFICYASLSRYLPTFIILLIMSKIKSQQDNMLSFLFQKNSLCMDNSNDSFNQQKKKDSDEISSSTLKLHSVVKQ